MKGFQLYITLNLQKSKRQNHKYLKNIYTYVDWPIICICELDWYNIMKEGCILNILFMFANEFWIQIYTFIKLMDTIGFKILNIL